MKYYFAWLGSKRAAKRGVCEVGSLLDQATHGNLPVPAGGILLEEFFQLALAEEIVQQNGDGVITAVSPQALHDLLYGMVRFPKIKEAVAIRPLRNNQFGTPISPINCLDPAALANSLCEGWQQQNGRHDLLIITLPQTQLMGTAVSPADATSDTIILPDEKITLPQLTLLQRPDNTLPPHAQRLQMLLRGLRRTFGHTGWEIKWMDDGRICWLWQLSPIPSE